MRQGGLVRRRSADARKHRPAGQKTPQTRGPWFIVCRDDQTSIKNNEIAKRGSGMERPPPDGVHLPMKPIVFSCTESLEMSPDEVAQQILDLANWTDFAGYAFLPGIQEAHFEVATPEIIGSRIKVTNRDGSNHVEEIVDWQPNRGLTMHLKEFSPPLARLATSFEEKWEFKRGTRETKVIRSFSLHARSALTWPLLWLISVFLKKAIASHLAQMRASAVNRTP
jgi:hypothetical protein